jgi:putative cardiolipin synthase
MALAQIIPGTRSARFADYALFLGAIALVSGCATVSFDEPRSESTYLIATAQTELGQWSTRWVDAHDGASGFYPLDGGMDALAARLGLAERAEKSIDLQYFLMKGDKAGLVIAKSLLKAADRGVRVRFLLDDIFTTASDRKLVLLNEHPNIEVRLFNPWSRSGFSSLNFVFDFRRANRRMHNKAFSVDNAVSIIGGRNIAKEYFELKDGAVFVDFDVLAFGPVVSEISESFDDFWNNSRALPVEYIAKPLKNETLESYRATTGKDLRVLYDDIYAGAFKNDLLQDIFTERRSLYPAPAKVIADSPGKLEETVGPEHQLLLNELRQLFLGAEHELLFVSPYYVPLANGVQFVRDTISSGIEVIMVTNSLASNNHIAVHSAYSKYRRDVIRAGMQLYETRANAGRSMANNEDGPEQMTLHTKLAIVDRRYLVVGSPNMDPRSLEINAEKALVIDSEPFAREIAEQFDEVLPKIAYRVLENESGKLEWHGRVDGQDVIEASEPQAGRWRRFKAWLFKIVPDRQL